MASTLISKKEVIRLYRGEEFIELEWIVGPVPIGTDLGKEVVSVFSTNITNSGTFYTDSNGRQMMRRTCWNDTAVQKKSIAACYFPVTSRICIKSPNSSIEMCVLTDRPQGGTSYGEGEIELMVHRRLLTDDGFGLEETLNEQAHGIGLVVKGKHRIVFGNYKQTVEEVTFDERVSQAARRWEMEPWLFFTNGDKISRRKWQNIRNKRYSALKLHGLPRHIHILTLEPWKGGSVLLRLENTLEKTQTGTSRSGAEGPEDTKSHITVELRKVFLHLRIKVVRETTLAANQWLNDARQMDWSTRYVYKGADDGIMAEDLVEDDDTSAPRTENKDSGNFSDEEKRIRRRPINRKSRSRFTKNAAYSRKKRSLSEKLNIKDNVINPNELKLDIVNHTVMRLNKTIKISTEIYHETTTKYLRKTPKKSNKMRVFNRPYKRNHSLVVNEEVRSSEEDFSSNLKKNLRKKTVNSMNNKEDTIIYNSDDGITKSMYEMYYKTKPKKFKSETFESRRKKNRVIQNKYDDVTESSRRKRKNKRFSVNMPFYTDRRLKKSDLMEAGEQLRRIPRRVIRLRDTSDEDEYNDEDYDDEDEELSMEDEQNHHRNRWKRMSPGVERTEASDESEPDPTLPEYVITLRQTQIRTFIVWFEINKKTYTL